MGKMNNSEAGETLLSCHFLSSRPFVRAKGPLAAASRQEGPRAGPQLRPVAPPSAWAFPRSCRNRWQRPPPNPYPGDLPPPLQLPALWWPHINGQV